MSREGGLNWWFIYHMCSTGLSNQICEACGKHYPKLVKNGPSLFGGGDLGNFQQKIHTQQKILKKNLAGEAMAKKISRKIYLVSLRPRHTMEQITVTRHCNKSPRLHCCRDKALGLFGRCDVAQIQISLNLCDRSQRQNSVAATMIFTCHTRLFVAATCRGDCRIVCLGLIDYLKAR